MDGVPQGAGMVSPVFSDSPSNTAPTTNTHSNNISEPDPSKTQILSSTMNTLEQWLNLSEKLGDSTYSAIVYASQRSAFFTQSNTSIQAWYNFLKTLPKLETTPKNIIILLSSLTNSEDWSRLSELIDPLKNIPPETLVQLETLLNRVSVPDSTGFVPVDTTKILFEKLSILPINNAALRTLVLGSTCQHLPMLKFQDASVAQATAFFIQGMAPFIDSLDALLKTVENINLEEMLKQQAIDKQIPDFAVAYLPKIQTFIDTFKTKLSIQVTDLKDLINTLTTTEKTEGIPDILKKMQTIIALLENPLEEFSLGTGLADITATLAVKAIISPMIMVVRKKVIDTLSQHILGTVHLQITDAVLHLGINDAVLDQDSEKNIKLSVAFKDFLIAQLPELSGKELALEMNAIFKQQEVLEKFVKRIKQVGNAARRDALIALLYRRGYFKKPETFFSIEKLTELVSAFMGSTHLNLEEAFTCIFDARETGVSVEHIQTKLALLSPESALFNDVEFQTLLKLSMRDVFPLTEFIALQKILKTSAFNKTRTSFALLLETAVEHPNLNLEPCLQALNAVLGQGPSYFMEYIHLSLSKKDSRANGIASLQTILTFLQQEPYQSHQKAILTILNGACWTHAQDKTIPLARQTALIQKLAAQAGALDKLQALYSKRPCPKLSKLEAEVSKTDFNIDAFIKAYECDPFGNRKEMLTQSTLLGVDSFLAEVKHLLNKSPLKAEQQEQLKEYVAYILGIGTQYALPIGNQLKPIREFNYTEIKEYYASCIQRAKDKPDDIHAKLEGLAIQCEVLFRTTGKYPYPSQIISVLNTLLFDDSILFQIPTGQGKSLTLALMAAMGHSFSAKDRHTTVCSRNKLLTGRDYQESLDFYRYLDIPVALVSASTEENHYTKPTIIYSTTADKSLYDSKLKIIDKVTFPPKDQQVVLCDEVDPEFFDNKNAFNFSEGSEDPYINPLEWLYPHLNAFIETPEFKNEYFSEDEDVENFRTFLKSKNAAKYEASFDRLTNFKLGQLLDSACAAKQLVEKTHFLVRDKTREVHGKMQTISEAHVLDQISHAEDTEATLSYGVQQCLHARLNQTYATEIALYQASNGKQGKPPFSCDNQIDCVDSQDSHSFFNRYGRIIGCTGTAGTPKELQEVLKELGIKTMLDIPPRKRGQLEYLPTVFSDKNAAFFFGTQTHLACIQRSLRDAKHQPVLISCENIHKADALFAALQKELGDKVQIIHAENASDPIEFQKRVDRAKEAGIVTITTPLAGRGVDIKTQSAGDSQDKLLKLAEKLLVIETSLDRYRARMQLQGRTARDAKAGQTIGIFDLEDIAQKYGTDLRPLNRADKLKSLAYIMDKLDNEACFERSITIQVNRLLHHYEDILDVWLKEVDDETRPKVLAAKVQLIDACHHTWQTLLADSDPKGQYINPYLRYKEDKTLDEAPLHALVQAFQQTLQEKIFPDCYTTFSIEKLSPISKMVLGQGPSYEADSHTATQANTSNAQTSTSSKTQTSEPEKTTSIIQSASASSETENAPSTPTAASSDYMAETYLKYAPKNTPQLNAYQENIQFKKTMDEQSNFWITHNPKTPEAVKYFAKTQQYATTNALTQEGKPVAHIHIAWLSTLTQNIQNNKDLSYKTLGKYLELQALAISDAHVHHKTSINADTEKEITEQTLLFLEKALEPSLMQLKDKKDAEKIAALLVDIKQLHQDKKITAYQHLHTTLMQTFNKPAYQVKSSAVSKYLQSLQQSVNAIAYGSSAASTPKQDVGEAYLERLTRISERLKERRDKAGFWKDATLYKEKIKRFEHYIQQAKTLIEDKKAQGISNIDNDIRALQTRMEQDKSIYSSTARFFKIGKNVMVIKDIKEASKDFTKKPG
ncbi:MAG: hypothetical protein Q8R79_08690 [Legionellaceae bacterium]|nr:hypothetical protein [Legionellaceae bacterium]